MKGTLQLVWNGYRYLPYEREFARREVKSLIGTAGAEIDGKIVIETDHRAIDYSKLRRFTYFRYVVLPNGEKFVPDQTLLEESSLASNERVPFSLMTRQSTRYSSHGLHEYRGKFNPQVVRAIGNIIGLSEGAWVLDPFCGSGTTLLECAHSGWNAVGIDFNPLGIFISNSKIVALKTSSKTLQTTATRLSQSLAQKMKSLDCEQEWSEFDNEILAGPGWTEQIPNFKYLSSWFARPVLAQVATIVHGINRLVEEPIRPIFLVVLSDILRDVSHQDPGDLRIRRRKTTRPNHPVIPIYLDRLQRRIESVSRAHGLTHTRKSYQAAFVGDSRLDLEWIADKCPRMKQSLFDAVITSPPYATALPYIDTQRLSLCMLGIASSDDIMGMDRRMIGTREILGSNRRTLDSRIRDSQGNSLSGATLSLCQQMAGMISASDGFRRRNMPALIYSYFHDMATVLHNVKAVLKPGGVFALIVGSNKTVLGGKTTVIETPTLLADMASSNGWDIADILELNTYQRYDVHQRNSIRTENLVLLRKPS